jgi:signal transduction histidine kinase
MMLQLSYKFRIPFSLVASALLTSLALGLVISFETYRNVVQDRIGEGTRLTHALTPILIQTLKHDDIWLAYSLLHGPAISQDTPTDFGGTIMVVIDENARVFASNRPREYNTGATIEQHAGLSQELVEQIRSPPTLQPLHIKQEDKLVLASGLFSEDAYRGALLIIYPVQSIWARFYEIISDGLWVILLVLVPLTLLGLYWGRHMMAPLIQLSQCMQELRTGNVDELECRTYEGQDEIGELGRQFQQMLKDLKEKRLLEQQMIVQERLAAIGRLAASVAHEINNPVGGMLMALDTWRHRPADERNPEKLLALIERGLDQIKETVSALLVESRIETRRLEPHDIEDIHTLLTAQVLPSQAHLHWSSQLRQEIDIPASAVRQILMNLVTNAIQAIGPGESVFVNVGISDHELHIDVSDTGKAIPAEKQAHLFEPFQSYQEGGTGLGLWVTYQIVKLLHGTISVESEECMTRFSVKLPLTGPTEDIERENSDESVLSHRADRGVPHHGRVDGRAT